MAAHSIPSSSQEAIGPYPSFSQDEFDIEDLTHVTQVNTRYPPSSLTSEQKVTLGDKVFEKFGKDAFLNFYYAYKLTDDERSQIYQLAFLRSVGQVSLNAMSGTPAYWNGINGGQTYARLVASSAVDFREIISEIGHFGSDDFKVHGEACHGTLLKLQEESSSGTEPSEPLAQAFFTTVRTYETEDSKRFDNCMKYAILNYADTIDERFGDRISDVEYLGDAYYFNQIVQKYFRNIPSPEVPQDGDLAVYENPLGAFWKGHLIGGSAHAGIYREESRHEGIIESKWGWSFSRHVFQHDVFLVPHHYGDVVKFYRLREKV